MNNKIFFFLLIYIGCFNDLFSNDDIYRSIQPEASSGKEKYSNSRINKFSEFAVVTANDYSTKIGFEILKRGGTVADAAVAIQLTLGLVEPQSSGLGGGLFLTYFDKESNNVISFEGREKAPINLKEDIFIDKDGKPKKFFDAVIGGASVGVPSTLKTLKEIHKNFGVLKWSEIIKPVIELSSKGFVPPKRLKNALEKEKFLFKVNPNSIFKKIKDNPNDLFFNRNYTNTLRVISEDVLNFYEKDIAKDIVRSVQNSKNPGNLLIKDLKTYEPTIDNALCYTLESSFRICGPNLPSSGTLCIIQALILFENIFERKKLKPDINEILDILNFVYHVRDNELADTNFEFIDTKELLKKENVLKNYYEFTKKDFEQTKLINLHKLLSSTSHFTIVDKYQNVLSATSSIESSFGSRLFTNGFFLNNQLTDFSFKRTDELGNPIKNRPQGGKRPLSSMSPLIIFDKNGEFLLTIGSPGGKAIISYVIKSLICLLYENKTLYEAIESPNYIRIKNKTYVENKLLNKKIKIKGLVRNLTSGLGIIKKDKNHYLAGADSRRDGTVRGN